MSSSPIAPYGQSVSADRQKINLEANPLTAPPPPFPPQVDERLNGDGTGLILGLVVVGGRGGVTGSLPRGGRLGRGYPLRLRFGLLTLRQRAPRFLLPSSERSR